MELNMALNYYITFLKSFVKHQPTLLIPTCTIVDQKFLFILG